MVAVNDPLTGQKPRVHSLATDTVATHAVVVADPSVGRLCIDLGNECSSEATELCARIYGQVARGFVSELTVYGYPAAPQLGDVVEAARLVGRPVRVVWRACLSTLPPDQSGRSWRQVSADGEVAWVLSGCEPPAWERTVKRVVDVLISAVGVMLLVPLFALIALAIGLDSSGGVLYEWRVLGRYGRPFTGYKFRTMAPNAHQMQQDLWNQNEMSGPVFKMTLDPRVTRVGRWLRRYSLDELPQLWSVLKGDMSLVGPRPASRAEYVKYEPWQLRKLSVTPGITCLWQVNGRNEVSDFGDWVRMDLDYIDNRSIWLDLRIIAKTALAVFKGTGR